jgi:trehalose 6-phosphate synthase/phosphatase
MTFQSVINMESKTVTEIREKYKSAKSRLVFLDYDGTLVNYTSIPDMASLPEHISEIIIKLIEDPGTDVYIITGRSHIDIDKFLDHVPVNIVAEHGAWLKSKGIWKNLKSQKCQWKETIIPIMEHITSTCPESFVEEKNCSVTWHYRNADPGIGYESSRELIRLLKKVTEPNDLKILDGNKVVEVLASDTGKGKAVKKLFEQNSYDFVLSVGDDATDEEMFEFFRHHSEAFTVKVGEGVTVAQYKLSNIRDVASLLKKMSG